MAVEVIVKSKKLKEAVASLYDAVSEAGLPNGGWAILGQVYLSPALNGVRIKMTTLPKHFADQISEVLVRAHANAERKRKRAKP